jgi:hypothetical protein
MTTNIPLYKPNVNKKYKIVGNTHKPLILLDNPRFFLILFTLEWF